MLVFHPELKYRKNQYILVHLLLPAGLGVLGFIQFILFHFIFLELVQH